MECGLILIVISLAAVLLAVLSAANRSQERVDSRDSTLTRFHPPLESKTDRVSGRSVPRLKKAATVESTFQDCWLAPGKAKKIGGYQIQSGMIYVGRNLPPVEPGWRSTAEPALIQPHLAVNRANPDRDGGDIGYWPCYEDLSARGRAGYLEWLSEGRRAPVVGIGYVFLFFYGLERRILADSKSSETAREEVDLLLQEVEELLEVYRSNSSFRRYATSLLDIGKLLNRKIPHTELEPSGTSEGRYQELPLRTKLALGAYSVQGKPIPSRWALEWVLQSPAFRLRTPVQRCPDEFRRLFEARYGNSFKAGGLVIKPNKTRLAATYRPASSSFGQGSVSFDVPDLPDVTILAGPVRKLQAVVDRVTEELEAYSRWVGRKGDRNSPAALVLLPSLIAAEKQTPES